MCVYNNKASFDSRSKTLQWVVFILEASGMFCLDSQTGRQFTRPSRPSSRPSMWAASGPESLCGPWRGAAEADKTQICWVPCSQRWPSTALTCSQNTKTTVGFTEGRKSFAPAFLQIHSKLSTISHRHQPCGGLDLMKWVGSGKTKGYFCCSNSINVSGRGEVTIQFRSPVFSLSLNVS